MMIRPGNMRHACNHSWCQDPTSGNGDWWCWNCRLRLSNDAVNLLRFQGHEIEMDYERFDKEVSGS